MSEGSFQSNSARYVATPPNADDSRVARREAEVEQLGKAALEGGADRRPQLDLPRRHHGSSSRPRRGGRTRSAVARRGSSNLGLEHQQQRLQGLEVQLQASRDGLRRRAAPARRSRGPTATGVARRSGTPLRDRPPWLRLAFARKKTSRSPERWCTSDDVGRRRRRRARPAPCRAGARRRSPTAAASGARAPAARRACSRRASGPPGSRRRHHEPSRARPVAAARSPRAPARPRRAASFSPGARPGARPTNTTRTPACAARRAPPRSRARATRRPSAERVVATRAVAAAGRLPSVPRAHASLT